MFYIYEAILVIFLPKSYLLQRTVHYMGERGWLVLDNLFISKYKWYVFISLFYSNQLVKIRKASQIFYFFWHTIFWKYEVFLRAIFLRFSTILAILWKYEVPDVIIHQHPNQHHPFISIERKYNIFEKW